MACYVWMVEGTFSNIKIILDDKLPKLFHQNTKRFVPPSCPKWDIAWRDCGTTTDALDTIYWKHTQIAGALCQFFFFSAINCDSNTVTATRLRPFPTETVFCWFRLHSATRAHFAHCSSCVVSAVPLSVFSAQVRRAHWLRVYAASRQARPAAWAAPMTHREGWGTFEQKHQSWRLIDKQLAAIETEVR